MWKDALKVDFSRFLLMRQYFRNVEYPINIWNTQINENEW